MGRAPSRRTTDHAPESAMSVQSVDLFPAVAYDRPADPAVFRPLPAGYLPDRLTIKRASDVVAGDLVVGGSDQPVHHPYRLMRWATYLSVPWVALPAAVDADCEHCHRWRCGSDGPTVCLLPHVQYRPDELVSVIAPVPGAEVVPPEVPCVHTCPSGGRLPGHYVRCGDCHGRPCAQCLADGVNSHRDAD